MTQEQERNLINRAQAGSVAAFELIVQHYQDRLLRFLMLRGMQQADAEDAAQTAFVRVWQNLPSYRAQWRFSTWLYSIAQRAAAEHKPLPVSSADLDSISSELDPCLNEQLHNNVWLVARNQLDTAAFEALWLHYAEGFSGKEVAQIMQRTAVWVRVTLHRARIRLHKLFTADQPTIDLTTVEPHEHTTP